MQVGKQYILMRLFNLIAFLFLSVAGFAAPVITSFSPTNAATGITVTIIGSNFLNASSVTFGGTPAASYVVNSSSKITAIIGAGTSGVVSVTNTSGTGTLGGFVFTTTSLTGLYTDYGGFWSSTTAAPSATIPNNSHNLLGFTYNSTTYATGVNNATLSANGVSFTNSSFKALPVAGIAGTNSGTLSTYLALGKLVDGNAATGDVSTISGKSIRSVMTDGVNGLDLGTGITNLPSTALLKFKILNIDPTKISDAEPDIVLTQIAQPVTGNDVFSFVDVSGNVIGNTKTQDMTLLAPFGTYDLDLFNVSTNTAFNNATVSSAFTSNTNREIRMCAFKLSEFGITASNYTQVAYLVVTPSGNSDYAFIAYNTNAITLPPNISKNDASTTTSFCTSGTAVMTTISTAAAAGTLSYVWERSQNAGGSWTTVTNGSGFSGATTAALTKTSATFNDKYRVTVKESTTNYTNTSDVFDIVSLATVSGTLAGANTVCSGTNSSPLSLSGNNGSILRWESSIDNFATASTIANTTSSYTATNLTANTKFRAVVQNGSCASANSNQSAIVVSSPSVGGNTIGSTSVCAGQNSASLLINGKTGAIMKWQSSTDNFVTSTDIANTLSTYTATNNSSTTQYRAVVQTPSCPVANSNPATVTVTANLWQGGTSGVWNNAANWCGGIPTLATDINIPGGGIIVNLSTGNGVVKSVSIASGSSLVMSGSYNLTLANGGTFANAGTFDASASSGTVSFQGSGTVSGTTTFKNVETNGALDFGTASSIAGEFVIQPGGSVTGHSPTYICPGSTLTYNAGGVYARSLEWPNVSTGPGLPSNVQVKNYTLINFPAIGAGYICNDLTIEDGSSLAQDYAGSGAPLVVGGNVTINGSLSLGTNMGDNISVGGNWTRGTSGQFNSNEQSVIFTGSSNAAITAPSSVVKDANGSFGGETFYDVEINKTSTASVSLGSNVAVQNELKLSQGILDPANSDVTLVSNPFTTAHLAALPSSGASISYSGTGRFIIQRNLPIGSGSDCRRWRLLTAPVQSSGAPTINEAWQESVSNSDRNSPVNPYPGFGIQITKSTTYSSTDGYDQGSTNNPSIYYYNPGVGWTAVASTKTPITNNEGYMIFARGDRSIVVSTPTINASPTTLEPKGKVITGDVTKTFVTGSQLIGNPYASAINFGKVTFNNYTSGGTTFNSANPESVAGITYYVFDPKTSGTSGVGKFITCSSRGDGTFDVSANNSGIPSDGSIKSGIAFLIRAENSGGTITFHEGDKVSSSSTVGIASPAFRKD